MGGVLRGKSCGSLAPSSGIQHCFVKADSWSWGFGQLLAQLLINVGFPERAAQLAHVSWLPHPSAVLGLWIGGHKKQTQGSGAAQREWRQLDT